MRFILTDNHLVRCENIKDYQEVNTIDLFPNDKPFVQANYYSVFEEIKSFIRRWKGEHEIFTSTLFYLIPGFITELADYLGKTTKVMPVRALIENHKLREVYDNYVIETVKNDDGIFSIEFFKENLLAAIKGKKMEDWLIGSGIPAVIYFNNKVNDIGMEDPSAEIFSDFYVSDESYEDLLKEKKGYVLFSPYSSLMFVNELVNNIIRVEDLSCITPHRNTEFSYSLSTNPETKPFNKSWESWVYVEMSNRFTVKMSVKGNLIRTKYFSIPEDIVKKSELQVGELHFGKFFMKIKGDFFGQLHIKLQTLNNNTYYGII